MKLNIYLISVIISIGFLLGWIFPLEGPLDEIYEETKKTRAPVVLVPPQISEKQIIEDEDEELFPEIDIFLEEIRSIFDE